MSKFNFIYAEDLSHREKTVYIYLRDRADASGVCWPGIKTIAGELGLSPRTVQRALADLERRRLIEKRQRQRQPDQQSVPPDSGKKVTASRQGGTVTFCEKSVHRVASSWRIQKNLLYRRIQDRERTRIWRISL